METTIKSLAEANNSLIVSFVHNLQQIVAASNAGHAASRRNTPA